MFAESRRLLTAVIENFELLRRLPFISGSQSLVGYSPSVPDHFLQRERVSIQLLRKVQQLLRIDRIRRPFLQSTSTLRRIKRSNCRDASVE